MTQGQPVVKYMAGSACVMCYQVSAHNMHPFVCSFVLSTLNLQAEMFQDTLVSTRYTLHGTLHRHAARSWQAANGLVGMLLTSTTARPPRPAYETP
jgi:hypothetical protein